MGPPRNSSVSSEPPTAFVAACARLGAHTLPARSCSHPKTTESSRAYALFEAATPPDAGPPPHVHHREDEAFCVLEGGYEFLVDGRILKAGAGSLLYVPKGTLHAHKNVGEGSGRVMLIQTPGGLYELFFEKAGRRVSIDGGPPGCHRWPKAGKIVKIAAEHGTEIPPITEEARQRYTTRP